MTSRPRHSFLTSCHHFVVQQCSQWLQLLCHSIVRRLLRDAREELPVAHDAELCHHAIVSTLVTMLLYTQTHSAAHKTGATEFPRQTHAVKRHAVQFAYGHFAFRQCWMFRGFTQFLIYMYLHIKPANTASSLRGHYLYMHELVLYHEPCGSRDAHMPNMHIRSMPP